MNNKKNDPSSDLVNRANQKDNHLLLQRLFEVADIIFVALNQHGEISHINMKGCSLLGYSEKDLLGKDWFKTCLPEHTQKKSRNIFEQLMTGEYSPIEYNEDSIITSDGIEKVIAWHNALMQDETTGQVSGTISAGIDMSEKKLAEDALRRSEDKYRALCEATFEGVAIHAKGAIIETNQAFASIFGYKLPELIGKPVLELVAPESRDLIDETVRSGTQEPVEALGLKKDGKTFHGELRNRNIKYRNNTVRVTTVRDISDRIQAEKHRARLEQQIHQGQKLESLGMITRGIAHDFNNLLTGILGNADLASLDCSPVSKMQDYLTQIKNSAIRLSGLTLQMLDYAGKDTPTFGSVDLSYLIQNTKQLLQASVPKRCELVFDLLPKLPSVKADPNQIRQIILNLVTNASDSIGKSMGVITLRTGIVDANQTYLGSITLNEKITEGTYVFLEVSDTGCGISPEDQDRIYNPFFTTKSTNRGLGLTTVLKIIRNHNGSISLDTKPECGSTFRLLLPIAEPLLPETDRPRSLAEDLSPNTKAILVVDDEESVRRVVKIILEKEGLRVWTANDGQEAIQIIKKQPDAIGVVLLDLAMPKLDGVETYQQIRNIREDLPVIISSGYVHLETTEKLKDQGVAGFIQKPYDHETLLKKMRQFLKT